MKTSSIMYKTCSCDDDFWEEIVVQNDEHYENKNVIYYHCSDCGEDFRVEELETAKMLQFKINPAELFN